MRELDQLLSGWLDAQRRGRRRRGAGRIRGAARLRGQRPVDAGSPDARGRRTRAWHDWSMRSAPPIALELRPSRRFELALLAVDRWPRSPPARFGTAAGTARRRRRRWSCCWARTRPGSSARRRDCGWRSSATAPAVAAVARRRRCRRCAWPPGPAAARWSRCASPAPASQEPVPAPRQRGRRRACAACACGWRSSIRRIACGSARLPASIPGSRPPPRGRRAAPNVPPARTLRRPALHARQAPQPFHLLHLAGVDARHRAGRDRAHHRDLGDERLRARAARPHPRHGRARHRLAAPARPARLARRGGRGRRGCRAWPARRPTSSARRMLQGARVVRRDRARRAAGRWSRRSRRSAAKMVEGSLDSLAPGDVQRRARARTGLLARRGRRRRGHGHTRRRCSSTPAGALPRDAALQGQRHLRGRHAGIRQRPGAAAPRRRCSACCAWATRSPACA